MTKRDKLPALTVVVLRGLAAAMQMARADVQHAEPNDFHPKRLEELQRAETWLTAVIGRRGFERVHPSIARARGPIGTAPRRRRVRVRVR